MKKYRQSNGLFLAEGRRTVQQIIENGRVEVVEIFATQSGADAFSWNKTDDLPASLVDVGVFNQLTDTENSQGIVGVCRIPDAKPIFDLKDAQGIIVALDGLNDPGNVGTIIRTASWFGVVAVLVGGGTVDVYHPKVVRSTAGATGAVPCIHSRLAPDLAQLEEWGWTVALLDGAEGAESLTTFAGGSKCVWVVGNEAHGVSDELKIPGRARVKIKRAGGGQHVESLNAAISAGIAVFYSSIGKSENPA